VITVTWEYGPGIGLRSVRVAGHAGHNPGNDIVCAAASVLACTLAAVLSDEAAGGGPSAGGFPAAGGGPSAGGVRLIACCLNPGDAFLRWRVLGASERPEAAADAIRRGFLLLADKYPAHVRLIVNDGR
jgi:hypothetical protein